jgi:hypothetical protein
MHSRIIDVCGRRKDGDIRRVANLVSCSLLLIADEVLGASYNTLVLNTGDGKTGENTGVVRVVTETFPVPTS